MTQRRLNDHVRATLASSDGRLSIATRASTGRGSSFGDAQSLSLTNQEARELRDFLNEQLEDSA